MAPPNETALRAEAPEALFLRHLPVIERLCSAVCRRQGCFGADAEDFASELKLKLVADDYSVLRNFRGQSRLTTYLTMVVANLFRDYRIRRWGKWRPSARARRLGETAVHLERLIHRDGHSVDEAATMLRIHLRSSQPHDELVELAAQLPQRPRRRLESDDQLAELPAAEQTDGEALARERAGAWRKVENALEQAVADLPAEDAVIVRMRFWDGFTVARIARALDLEQRPLYSRLEKLLRGLRAKLESQGLDLVEISDLLDGE